MGKTMLLVEVNLDFGRLNRGWFSDGDITQAIARLEDLVKHYASIFFERSYFVIEPNDTCGFTNWIEFDEVFDLFRGENNGLYCSLSGAVLDAAEVKMAIPFSRMSELVNVVLHVEGRDVVALDSVGGTALKKAVDQALNEWYGDAAEADGSKTCE